MSVLLQDPHPGVLIGTNEAIVILGVDIPSEKLLCLDAKGKPFITTLASVEWEYRLVFVEDEEGDAGLQ